MEIEAAFSELNKPQNVLLEFIFHKLYKKLSKNSKKILRALALYKDIPDRNIIAYIAELDTEEQLMDAIFELEQHSLINQERMDSKNGIIETINLLGLAQTFINNITDIDQDLKEKYERRIIDIEQELDKISNDDNRDFRPAQKLAQSKLLQALKISTEKVLNKKVSDTLVKEAERLAPRFYLIYFYKALIELNNPNYEYGVVKQLFIEALSSNYNDPRLLFEYGRLLKRHKKESFKEYAPIFRKAFEIEQKIGYGIEAGVAYFENGDFKSAFEIIQRLKETEPSFPKDNQHKYWTSKTVLNLAEMEILKDNAKAIELLNSIEKNIDILSQERTREYKMLKAKFCSLLGLIYAFTFGPVKAREFLTASNEILNTYKSVNRDSFEVKELVCYNYIIEAALCNDQLQKNEKLKKVENEYNSGNRKELMLKFTFFVKKVRQTI